MVPVSIMPFCWKNEKKCHELGKRVNFEISITDDTMVIDMRGHMLTVFSNFGKIVQCATC
jgi:hypothetical protein